MPTIFITLFDIVQLKNFFYTGFYDVIKGKVKVVLICPERNVEYLRQVFNDDPNISLEGVDINLHPDRWQFLLGCARQGALRTRSGYAWFIGRARAQRHWKKYWFYLGCYWFFANRLGHWLLAWLEDRLFPPGAFQYLFDRYRPDLVFSTNVISTIDFRVLKDAQRNGVKAITNLKSWDNSTMKGFINVKADKVIVQNAIQRQELIKYHHVPATKLVVLGNPGFDIYYNPEGLLERGQFCRQAGLDPKKKIIFMNISAPFINPFPEDPILHVDQWISQGKINLPAQILISPRSKYGFSERLLHNAPNVVVHLAGEMIGGGAKSNVIFSKQDVYDLKNCLAHADAVITTGSTLGMEATMLDTPSISLAFDWQPINYWLSARVRAEDEYWASTRAAGGVRMAWSPEELLLAINDYLTHPEQDRTKRQQVAREQSQFCDDQAGRRIGQFILSELGL